MDFRINTTTVFFSSLLFLASLSCAAEQHKKITAIVSKGSISAEGLEDGFSFRVKEKEYYIYYNGDSNKAQLRAGELVTQSEKQQKKICLTVDKDNYVLSASAGACK